MIATLSLNVEAPSAAIAAAVSSGSSNLDRFSDVLRTQAPQSTCEMKSCATGLKNTSNEIPRDSGAELLPAQAPQVRAGEPARVTSASTLALRASAAVVCGQTTNAGRPAAKSAVSGNQDSRRVSRQARTSSPRLTAPPPVPSATAGLTGPAIVTPIYDLAAASAAKQNPPAPLSGDAIQAMGPAAQAPPPNALAGGQKPLPPATDTARPSPECGISATRSSEAVLAGLMPGDANAAAAVSNLRPEAEAAASRDNAAGRSEPVLEFAAGTPAENPVNSAVDAKESSGTAETAHVRETPSPKSAEPSAGGSASPAALPQTLMDAAPDEVQTSPPADATTLIPSLQSQLSPPADASASAEWLNSTTPEKSASPTAGVSQTPAGKRTGTPPSKTSTGGSENSSDNQSRPGAPADGASVMPLQPQPPTAATQSGTQPAIPGAALAGGTPANHAARPPSNDANSDVGQRPAPSAGTPRDPDTAPAAPMIVQSARVIGRMEQTEMRVGVNTADFGSVELRAGISQDRVSATISAAHLELHAAMVAEMPSLERAIGQHQLHLDALDFRSPSGNQQRGAEAQQQHHPAMPSGTRLSDTAGPASQTESSPTAPGMETGSQRLNIHA